MPSSLQRQSQRESRGPSALLPLIRSWTKRRKLEFANQRRPNSCVTSGMCSRMNRHRLAPKAAALLSPAVRLAASASIHSINSFGTNLTMCCPLFCGRLSRLPAFRLRHNSETQRAFAFRPAIGTNGISIQYVFLLVATHTDRQELPSFSVYDRYRAAGFHVGWSFDLHESILTDWLRT
jgi:hypothetical protein